MNNQLLIPDRINVGYNNRQDTYTGKLAYVIYFDNKGVLRKEASWNSWRNEKLGNDIYENKPMSGFVLNKKVGGTRGHSWEQRQTYSRVYDPRGFEFEITVPNLLFILQECDCSRGKGLEGEFVYAWQGTDLVLLPVTSLEYQNSKIFTDLKTMKVAAKDLIIGATYETKNQEKIVYLGQFNKFDYQDWRSGDQNCNIVKRYVYYNPSNVGEKYRDVFMDYGDMSQIARLVDPAVVGNYAELVDELNKHKHYGKYKSYQAYQIAVKTEYSYWDVRSSTNDLKAGRCYKELSPNTFAEFDITLLGNTSTQDYGRYSSRIVFKNCKLSQTRIITFNTDGTIDLKNKNVKDDKIYNIKSDIMGGQYQIIEIKTENSKNKFTI